MPARRGSPRGARAGIAPARRIARPDARAVDDGRWRTACAGPPSSDEVDRVAELIEDAGRVGSLGLPGDVRRRDGQRAEGAASARGAS